MSNGRDFTISQNVVFIASRKQTTTPLICFNEIQTTVEQ